MKKIVPFYLEIEDDRDLTRASLALWSERINFIQGRDDEECHTLEEAEKKYSPETAKFQDKFIKD